MKRIAEPPQIGLAAAATEPAFEVLPPDSGKNLESIETQIREIQHTLREKERAFYNEAVYDVVAIGLYLLKGREVHLRQHETQFGSRGVETVSTPDGGFLVWLAEKFPEVSDRTARNYMNAARNAGLTSDHTLADVEELRAKLVLHDKRPTDLYKLVDANPATPEEKPAEPTPNLVAEVAHTRRAALDQTLSLRDTMSEAEYEAAWVELKDTLEKLTGAHWVMEDTADTSEHAAQQISRLHAQSRKENKGKPTTQRKARK